MLPCGRLTSGRKGHPGIFAMLLSSTTFSTTRTEIAPLALFVAALASASLGCSGQLNLGDRPDGSTNPGEAGGAAGLGLGAGIGMMMPQMIAGAMGAQSRPQVATTPCPKCQTPVAAGAKFCPSCGTSVAPEGVTCPKCQTVAAAGSKFCGNCGQALSPAACPKCSQPLAAGAKFCGNCGTKIE